MKKIWIAAFLLTVGLSYRSADANSCMCPGVNPEMYPPDLPALAEYYRNDFKGAALTGKVVSLKELPEEKTELGDNLIQVDVEVQRAWIGEERPQIRLYSSTNPCGRRFELNKSYFFIPKIEDGRLYIGPCAYATYSSKPDGNYVELMVAIFGEGKRFDTSRDADSLGPQ